MRDAHQVIVDHIGQMIGRHAIGLEQDLGIHLRPIHLDGATQHVLDHTGPIGRHLHSHHMRPSLTLATRHFLLGQGQVIRLQGQMLTSGLAFLPQGIELLAGSVALEGMARIK